MQFPISWLFSFLEGNLPNPYKVAELFTMAGLETECNAYIIEKKIVTAIITQVKTHPYSKRLKICTVNDGSEIFQIVCGAKNIISGKKFPFAKINAKLPGSTIYLRNILGINSPGMLCSLSDLGLSNIPDNLLFQLPDTFQIGEPIFSAFGLNDDFILNVKITPNRPDCLSINGLARELSLLKNDILFKSNKTNFFRKKFPDTNVQHSIIQVLDKDLCGRVVSRSIRKINLDTSLSFHMKHRLSLSGISTSEEILNDLSTYFLIESGQPSLIFDEDLIGSFPLILRWSKSEEIIHINGKKITLDMRVGLIELNKNVVAAIGLSDMEHVKPSKSTKNIIVVMPFLWPDSISGISKHYHLFSEAIYRFERGVDYQSIPDNMNNLTRLIQTYCSGDPLELTDQTYCLPKRNKIAFNIHRCKKILGIKIKKNQIENIFKNLNFDISSISGGFLVVPPSYRFDISIEADLIEEVARIYGFDKIPYSFPIASFIPLKPSEVTNSHYLRKKMANRGYNEVINFSFSSEEIERDIHGNLNLIRILNPISKKFDVMRSSLIGGLIYNIKYNSNRGISCIRIFEIGRAFFKNKYINDGPMQISGVDQPNRLAGAAFGSLYSEQWNGHNRNINFFDVKKDIEILFHKAIRFEFGMHPSLHPGKVAIITQSNHKIGWIGELHPKIVKKYELPSAPVVFEIDLETILKNNLVINKQFSNTPIVTRDANFLLNTSISSQDLLDSINKLIKLNKEFYIIQSVKIFDVWEDFKSTKNFRSIGVRFFFQDKNVNLDDSKVNKCFFQLCQLVTMNREIQLRSE